jgi:hypothetical protein
MMIDFALDAQRNHGETPERAIHQACLMRFRPIMMTTLAAIMGSLPIALGLGAGAELRQPLGIAVVRRAPDLATPHALHYAGHLPLSRGRAPPSGEAEKPASGRLAACGLGVDFYVPDICCGLSDRTKRP